MVPTTQTSKHSISLFFPTTLTSNPDFACHSDSEGLVIHWPATMVHNKAAWLMTKGAHPFQIDEAPMPDPEPNEIVLRTHAVAINPVDWGIQSRGILVDSYPASIGCVVAGDFYAVGSNVKGFSPGDRAIGVASLLASRPNKGTFQLYCAVDQDFATRLPDNVSYTDGCVLPLALITAACALFTKGNLGLPYPRLTPQPIDKVVLVWGGSSSVGSCATQMAKAAGFEVATTCGAHNAEYCRGIGADYVFDHTTKTVVDDVVKALRGKTLAGVLECVFPPETIVACAQIADQLDGSKHLMTVLTCEHGLVVPEGLPARVKTGYSRCSRLFCLQENRADVGGTSSTSYPHPRRGGWTGSLEVARCGSGEWIDEVQAERRGRGT